MDFLASSAIVIIGACLALVGAAVGFFSAVVGSPDWRWSVLLVGGVALLVAVWLLASARTDGQPAVVYGGRTGGSDELADSGGAIGGLWLRSMLLHVGFGVVVAWLLVTLINLRNRSR